VQTNNYDLKTIVFLCYLKPPGTSASESLDVMSTLLFNDHHHLGLLGSVTEAPERWIAICKAQLSAGIR